MEFTKEEIAKYKKWLETAIEKHLGEVPIYDYNWAKGLKLTMDEFNELLRLDEMAVISRQYKAMKRAAFYSFSVDAKIAKGIDLYIQEELMKDDVLDDLKVIVDITDYQKQLQPFTQNQESIAIQNKRNKITRPDPDDEITEETLNNLEELGIEVIEPEVEDGT